MSMANPHAVLPDPDPAEREISARVEARVREAIVSAGGAISFDHYMAIALYEPGLGYYAGGRRKFGAAGDFVTAPELSPLFGACVAVQLARWLPALSPCIWEFGAGSGALAAQVLSELDALGHDTVEYRIIELSAELRARQQATLAASHPRALERVQWLAALPDRIDGIVLANELLDALPVELFSMENGELCERVVERVPGSAHESLRGSRQHAGMDGAPSASGLRLGTRAPDAAFARRVRARLARAGWPDAPPLGSYHGEIGEQASAWVSSVAERLGAGVMLLIDYGFPAAEFYHPARASGTLNCHYRHRSHADPLWRPGLCDITAHVDFSAVHDAATAAGLTCLGYGAQSAFLLGCGLAELFSQRVSAADPAERIRAAHALQLLVSEAEMGELFKVIALGSDPACEPLLLDGRDRRAVLIA